MSKAASSGRDGLPAFAGTGGSRWSFCVSLRFREVMAAELSFRKVDDDAEQKRPARPFQTPTHHFARTVQDGIHAPSTMLRAVCDGCSTQCCSCFDLESVQHIEASEADLGGRRPSAIRQARRQGQEDHRRRLSCRCACCVLRCKVSMGELTGDTAIHTTTLFPINHTLKLLLASSLLSQWCPPCKMLDPILQKVLTEEIEGENEIDYMKINTDNENELAAKYKVRTLLFSFPGPALSAESPLLLTDPSNLVDWMYATHSSSSSTR